MHAVVGFRQVTQQTIPLRDNGTVQEIQILSLHYYRSGRVLGTHKLCKPYCCELIDGSNV